MTDDLADWVLLSEIEHWAYCPRQWAIIHLDQYFADNDATVRGSLAHERVDRAGSEQRGNLRTVWALPVRSDAHRLRGKCDRVDFRPDDVVPVEHKSGRRALHPAEVQLAAQAMCLEEMLHVHIRVGELYLVATNQTRTVPITRDMRMEVISIAEEVRSARHSLDAMPAPANDQRCPACSLNEACLPSIVGAPSRVSGLHGATWWP